VILSPSLVTSRAVQLTPAYTEGPSDGERCDHPARAHCGSSEWDDFVQQLAKPRNVANYRAGRREHAGRSSTPPPTISAARAPTSADSVIKLSQAFRTRDHSKDVLAPSEPVHPGVGVAGQHRSDAAVEFRVWPR